MTSGEDFYGRLQNQENAEQAARIREYETATAAWQARTTLAVSLYRQNAPVYAERCQHMMKGIEYWEERTVEVKRGFRKTTTERTYHEVLTAGWQIGRQSYQSDEIKGEKFYSEAALFLLVDGRYLEARPYKTPPANPLGETRTVSLGSTSFLSDEQVLQYAASAGFAALQEAAGLDVTFAMKLTEPPLHWARQRP